jgi:hypothetical protein
MLLGMFHRKIISRKALASCDQERSLVSEPEL